MMTWKGCEKNLSGMICGYLGCLSGRTEENLSECLISQLGFKLGSSRLQGRSIPARPSCLVVKVITRLVLFLPITTIIIIDLSYIMYNDLWMRNKTKN
jgi:hypothetical protein